MGNDLNEVKAGHSAIKFYRFDDKKPYTKPSLIRWDQLRDVTLAPTPGEGESHPSGATFEDPNASFSNQDNFSRRESDSGPSRSGRN